MIACKTTIGYGAPTKAGTNKAHGEMLGAEELKGAKEKLGISLEPFSVPDDVLKAWREAGSRGAAARKEWEAPLRRRCPTASAPSSTAGCAMSGRPSLAKALKAHKKSLLETPQNIATRKSSELAIDAMARGDADGIPVGLGRPHRLDQQQGQDPPPISRPRPRRAASSITASASTAWRRR